MGVIKFEAQGARKLATGEHDGISRPRRERKERASPLRSTAEIPDTVQHARYAGYAGYGEFNSLREIAVPQGEPCRVSSVG